MENVVRKPRELPPTTKLAFGRDIAVKPMEDDDDAPTIRIQRIRPSSVILPAPIVPTWWQRVLSFFGFNGR